MNLRAAGVEIGNLDRFIHSQSIDSQLKRGFSIATHNGKVIRDPRQLSKGQTIDLLTQGGRIRLIVD
jgi:exonuclease VII large subunit